MNAPFDATGGAAEANGHAGGPAGDPVHDQAHDQILGPSDRLEILKIQAWWTAMVRAGRPERAAELCAEDVVVLPPDAQPICGREAARAWLAGLNGGAVERIEVAGVDLRGGPRSAWLTATVTTTRLAHDGVRSQERQRRLWALVKDGAIWRVRVAGWESAEAGRSAPPAGAPATRSDDVEDLPDRTPWRNLFRR